MSISIHFLNEHQRNMTSSAGRLLGLGRHRNSPTLVLHVKGKYFVQASVSQILRTYDLSKGIMPANSNSLCHISLVSHPFASTDEKQGEFRFPS